MKEVTSIVKHYLHKSKHFINDGDFALHLQSNPSYPSLKAVSDTLDYFKIQNIVASVPKKALDQLPSYFLAVTKNHMQEEVIMVRKRERKVEILGQQMEKTIGIEDFLNIWTGTVIIVEQQQDRPITVSKEIIFLSVLLVLVLLIQLFSINTTSIAFCFLASAGIFLSGLIIGEEAGYTSRLVKKVCSKVDNNGGCDEVIRSTDSKVFGIISLSSAGMAFFLAQLLVINLLGINFIFFVVLSFLGLPIIFYSLYSQAFRLKKWCALCLGLSTLFFINVVLLTISILNGEHTPFDIMYHIKGLLIIISVYVCIDYLKLYFLDNIILHQDKVELYKLKKDLTIFNAVLKETKPNNFRIVDGFKTMSFGVENAVLRITAVTNPTCGFCAESFNVYFKLLEVYPDKVKIDFIFNVPFEDQNNIATKIATKAISLHSQNYKYRALEMLKEWYSERNFEAWLRKYGQQQSEDYMEINHILATHKYWTEINELSFTPATIINGYLFPDNYQISDLLLIANDYIIDEEEKQKTLVMEMPKNIVAQR